MTALPILALGAFALLFVAAKGSKAPPGAIPKPPPPPPKPGEPDAAGGGGSTTTQPTTTQPTTTQPTTTQPTETVTVVPSSPDRDAVQESADDAAAHRFQDAVAKAVREKDARQLLAIAVQMRAEGLDAEAESLEDQVRVWRAQAAEQSSEETGETVTEQQVAEQEEPAPEPTISPEKQAAIDYAELVYKRWTQEGGPERSYDRAWLSKVAEHQKAIGRTADGYFGPGDAEVMISYGIVPPDPFHWSSTNTDAQVADYKDLLRSAAAADPQREDLWLSRVRTAGR